MMHSRVSEAKTTKNAGEKLVLGYDFLADQIDQQNKSENEEHKADGYCAYVGNACSYE